MQTKQVKLQELPRVINKIVKAGGIITKTKYNGQPSQYKYVLIEYIPRIEQPWVIDSKDSKVSGFSLSSIAWKKKQKQESLPWE